jgi:uncharacterized protein with beta-barrel porin domain
LQLLQQYLDSSSTSDSQRDSALQSITPQTDNSQNSFTITTSSVSTAQDRLQSLHQEVRDETCNDYNGRGIWIQEFGTIATQGSSSKWNGYDARSFGTAVGIDKEFFENTHLGVSLSYARSTITSKPSPKTISLNTYQLNVYGGKNFGQFYIDGILGFAWNDYYSTRSISSVGVVAKGDYSGQTYIARTEGGYVFDLGKRFTITPFNSLTYAVNANNEYTESGAGTLSLNVSSSQTNFFEERVGLRLMHNGIASGNSRINSRIQASYGYNFYTTKQTADNNFVGQTASFQSSAANIYQGSLKLGAGVDIVGNNAVTFSFNYGFEARQNYQAHFGMLRLRYDY